MLRLPAALRLPLLMLVLLVLSGCGERVVYVPVTVTPGPESATGSEPSEAVEGAPATVPTAPVEPTPAPQSAAPSVAGEIADIFANPGALTLDATAGEVSRIAFMGPLGQGGAIQSFVVNSDGSGLRLVSEAIGEGYFPTLSPDGSRVAFMANTQVDPDIYVVDIASGEITNLTDRPGFDNQPIWSPDGSQIAFVSDREGGDTDIWLMNADGSEPRRLARTPGDDLLGSWNPDGTQIAYSNQDELGERLWVLDVQSGESSQLTDGADGVESAPSWSPDGERIAYYAVGDGGVPQIVIMNADGSEAQRITTSDEVVLLPVWSPDGSRLAVTSRPTAERFDMLIIDVESGARATVPDVQGLATSWSRADTLLADTGFTQGPKNTGVEVSPAVLESAYRKGSPDAPIKIVEFSDYQCPFCQSWYANTLPQLEPYIEDGTVELIFVDYPLSIHPNAPEAAVAARCAGELAGNDGYWTMHDALFDSLPEWNPLGDPTAFFVDLGAQDGLDAAALQSCIESGRYDEIVQAGLVEGNRLSVSGTPTFFVNGNRLVGAQPFETFQAFLP